ncbi:MAG: glycerol-3-phosphate acyltransferase [Dehalococcoidales bacterium]|jgi:glycerol-3-phosphate acyltransferase PlsY
MTWSDLGFILGSYLLGSIPQLYLLGLLKGKRLSGDLHHELWRQCGRSFGVIGFLSEMVKGALPVLIGRALHLDIAVIAVAGVAGVCGQMWPLFYHFDGEKGNSVGAAMALALTPLPLLIALIPMLGGFLIRTIPRFMQRGQSVNEKFKLGGPPSNSFPLGMAVGFAVLPLAAWALGWSASVVLSYTALFVLIMIRRATAGLSADIKKRKNLFSVIFNRLLYDRADF